VTRINTVDVTLLSDQHLMAEYRELPMVHGSLKRTLNSAKGFQSGRVSPIYTLNAGHVYFWYNKKKFLFDRFNQLVNELIFRNYQINPGQRIIDWNVFDRVPQIDWTPTEKECDINLERVVERIKLKPKFYRWTNRDRPLSIGKYIIANVG
jgi:deoxyribonuclease (pyrimidine dimer)